MVEAIIYRYWCGLAWRDLPEVFGPWQTVLTWLDAWLLMARGTGAGAVDAAAEVAGAVDRSIAVDSTITRAHQHATNIARHTGGWVEFHESAPRAA